MESWHTTDPVPDITYNVFRGTLNLTQHTTERLYQQTERDVDELRRRLIVSWSSIMQQTVIDQWRFTLTAQLGPGEDSLNI